MRFKMNVKLPITICASVAAAFVVAYETNKWRYPQPARDHYKARKEAIVESEVVAGGGEDGVGGVAAAAFEMATTEVTVGLHVTDHGFNGGAASELAFDDAEHAAFLSRDAAAAVSLVDIASFDGAAGETLGGFDGRACARRRDCPAAPWRAARTARREHGRWW
jgi:hypothetical protein